MAKSNEYLERRCTINEAVLHNLGAVFIAYVPAAHAALSRIGKAWDEAIDTLDREIPDAPPEEPKG